jgi:hypothetical protein
MLGKEFSMLPEASQIRRLDEGRIEPEYDRTIRFANLAVSPEGFSFNVLMMIKQTNFDLDADGNRILPGRVMDRTLVNRMRFGRSQSTGKIVGHRDTLYSDSPRVNFGMTGNMIMSMEEDKLVILTIPGGYFDGFAAGGEFVPRTARIRMEVDVRDDKVFLTSTVQIFDVDADTLEMTPTGETTTTVDVAEI